MEKAIKEALSLLQMGTKLDVVAAIEVLQRALREPKPCLNCQTPEYCGLQDRCTKDPS